MQPPSHYSRPMASKKSALALLSALVLAGCVHADGEEKGSRPEGARSGTVTVSRADGEVDASYVVGDRLYRGRASRPVKLAAAVNTNLIGTLSPVAVPAPGLLAYNSSRGRRPVVRLRELSSGKDEVLDDGALSLAWRRDGALAYFKAVAPDLRTPARYVGHVVVRSAPQAAPVRWTPASGRYVVAAWAGRRLLVYRLDKSWPDLLVLDRPGQARILAKAGALVALSPDGRRAFVSTYGASPPVAHVLDVPTGREVARRSVRALRWLTESGSWAGDLVAAPASSGVAVFRVGARTIDLEQTLRFGPGFSAGPFEPQLEDVGRRIVGWAEVEPRPRQAVAQAGLIECDRVTLQCVHAVVATTASPPRLVYDPSRPK